MQIICPYCEGSGKDPDNPTENCPRCGGSGEVKADALGGLEVRQESILTKLDALDRKMDTLDTHLSTIETKIDALE